MKAVTNQIQKELIIVTRSDLIRLIDAALETDLADRIADGFSAVGDFENLTYDDESGELFADLIRARDDRDGETVRIVAAW